MNFKALRAFGTTAALVLVAGALSAVWMRMSLQGRPASMPQRLNAQSTASSRVAPQQDQSSAESTQSREVSISKAPYKGPKQGAYFGSLKGPMIRPLSPDTTPDAVSREISIRVTSDAGEFLSAVSRLVSAQKQSGVGPDSALSREISASNGRHLAARNAVSREVAINNGRFLPFRSAVSREVAIARLFSELGGDALSREVSLSQTPPSGNRDAISRILSITRSAAGGIGEALSREVTADTRNAARFLDAVSRQIAVYSTANPGSLTDNSLSREVSLRIPEPNLSILNLTAPSVIYTDVWTRISWDSINLGSGVSLPPWVDRIFLSADTTFSNDPQIGELWSTAKLGAQERVGKSQEVYIPEQLISQEEQQMSLFLFTDAGNHIFERDKEADNVFRIPVTVRKTQKPDLIVPPGQLIAPAAAVAGGEFEVRFTVRNVGKASTDSSQWRDWVYLSPDPKPDQGDPVVYQLPNGGYLDAGGSYTMSQRILVPRELAGSLYVIVCTDGPNETSPNSVVEADNTNNYLSVPISIVAPSNPDLVVTRVQAPATAAAGGEMLLDWTVKNQGLASVPPGERDWNDATFLSKDLILDNQDIFLGKINRQGNLTPSASYSQTAKSFTVPKLLEGDYFVLVRTDNDQSVFEFPKDDNNTTAAAVNGVPRAVKIVATPPDLKIVEAQVATTGKAGTAVSVSWRVENVGAFSTDQTSWVDLVYLSKDSVIDSQDIVISRQPGMSPLNRGRSYRRSATYTIPDCESGPRFILIKTDGENQLPEFSQLEDGEQNNQWTSPRFDLVSNLADLSPISLSASTSTVQAGSPFTVTWTVTNRGTEPTSQSSWTDSLYIQSLDSSTAPEFFLGTLRRDASLLAGQNYTLSRLVTVPFGLKGQCRLIIKTDTNNEVVECDGELNNVLTLEPVTVTVTAPDLTTSDLLAPQTVLSGALLEVSYKVTNVGLAPAALATWTDSLFLSKDQLLDPSDQLVASAIKLPPLGAGQDYNGRLTAITPIIEPGDYYALVVSNQTETLFEDGRMANNRSSRLISIRSRDQDLQVTRVEALDAGISGQPITVSWTVSNVGGDSVDNPSWTDRVYLSKDLALDATDLALAYRTREGGLASNLSYAASLDVVLPTGLSGPYYIIVQTDDGNVVRENYPIGELNNWRVDRSALLIQLPPPVDLTVQSLSSPGDLRVGAEFAARMTIKNLGSNTAVGSWRNGVYLSIDNRWSSDDPVLSRLEQLGPIAPQGTVEVTISGEVPPVNPGTYYLVARTDIRQQVRESNETNNTFVLSTPVAVTVETIPRGSWVDSLLANGKVKYWRTASSEGETLKWSYEDPDVDSWIDLFTNRNRIASLYDYETRSEPFSSKPTVSVPSAANGFTYGTALAVSRQGTTAGRVRVHEVPFGITSVSPERVGDTGQVTVTLRGGRLGSLDRGYLTVGGKRSEARSIKIISNDTVQVTFFHEEFPRGTGAIFVSEKSGRTLSVPIEVEKVVRPTITVSMPTGRGVRAGQIYTVPVTMQNVGNIDAQVVEIGIYNTNQSVPFKVHKPGSMFPKSAEPQLSRYYGLAYKVNSATIYAENISPGQSISVQIQSQVPSRLPGNSRSLTTTVAPISYSGADFDRAMDSRVKVLHEAIQANHPDLASRIPGFENGNAWSQEVIAAMQSSGAIPTTVLKGRISNLDDELDVAGSTCRQCDLDYLARLEDVVASVAVDMEIVIAGALISGGALTPALFANVIKDFLIGVTVATVQYFCDKYANENPTSASCQSAQDAFVTITCAGVDIVETAQTLLSFKTREDLDKAIAAGLLRGKTPSETFLESLGSTVSGISSSVNALFDCIQNALDPNDLAGPTGMTEGLFWKVSAPWQYHLRFENLGSAGAVRIELRTALSSDLDWRSYRPLTLALGQEVLELPDTPVFSLKRRVQVQGRPVDLAIDSILDIRTGEVTMVLEGFDPSTGEPLSGVLDGLLLPEDGSGRGQGSLTWDVNVRTGLAEGTLISSRASIIFDTEPPIETNLVSTRVDSISPTSAVRALPATSGRTFLVEWSGQDAGGGSGLAGCRVLVRKLGGEWSLWKGATQEQSAIFEGEAGVTYQFRSEAVDLAGNVEVSDPNSFDAETKVQ